MRFVLILSFGKLLCKTILFCFGDKIAHIHMDRKLFKGKVWKGVGGSCLFASLSVNFICWGFRQDPASSCFSCCRPGEPLDMKEFWAPSSRTGLTSQEILTSLQNPPNYWPVSFNQSDSKVNSEAALSKSTCQTPLVLGNFWARCHKVELRVVGLFHRTEKMAITCHLSPSYAVGHEKLLIFLPVCHLHLPFKLMWV